MSAPRNDQEVSVDLIPNDAARLDWLRPEVRRMDAEWAETGSNSVTDLGVTQS